MKYEIDSYILEYLEDENKYDITFRDSVNNECKIEIEREIFDTYINSKTTYVKMKNETSRYLERMELSDESLYNRAFYKTKSSEDEFIEKEEKIKVNKAMDTLTKIQQRRIELHCLNKITIRDIAKLENVQKSQIEKSLKLARKKFLKFFKK